jgi:hypothetical protein
MITILPIITDSMCDAKHRLDGLQQASITADRKRKKSPQFPQIVQIRQELHLYWISLADLLRDACFQIANRVRDLQYVKRPSQLLEALAELKTQAEKCISKAKALIAQHDEFIRCFRARNIRLPGSDGIVTNFTQACGSLRAGLIDLLALIEEKSGACAAYHTAVRANYTSAMLEEFTLLGKEWGPYALKAKETSAQVYKLCDDIIGSGVKQPTPSEGSKRRCIIM